MERDRRGRGFFLLWWCDNLNVVGHVARMVDGFMPSRPPPLVKDEELVGLVPRLLCGLVPGSPEFLWSRVMLMKTRSDVDKFVSWTVLEKM